MGWTIRGSNPGINEEFLSSTKLSDRLWGLVSLLLFGEYRDSLPEVKQRDVMLTAHLHPEPRLRMRGAIPLPLLYVFMAWTRTTFTVLLKRKCTGTNWRFVLIYNLCSKHISLLRTSHVMSTMLAEMHVGIQVKCPLDVQS